MQGPETDPSRPIKIGLMVVIAFMSWPIWLAVISGEHRLSWAVAASVLLPIAATLAVPLVAMHAARRMARQVGRAEHALHIDSLLHR